MRAIINLKGQNVVELCADSASPRARAADEVLVAVQESPADFDAATQTRVFARYEIAAAKVIRYWTVTAKTQQEIYETYLAAGYTDPTTGLKLKTTEYAQTKFTQQFTLLSAALAAGLVQDSEVQTFWDYAEQQRQLSTSDLLSLLLRYGQYCAQLFHDYAP